MQQQLQAQQQQLAHQQHIIQQQQAALAAHQGTQQPLAAHQAAPAMQTGAVPLCPLSIWCGGKEKDAETMLTLLDSALEANGVLSIQQEPQRYLAVLLQCCSREQKALEFLSKYKVTNPNSSVPEIKQAFLDRFQAEGSRAGTLGPATRHHVMIVCKH